jgi:hypothetical protein
MYWSVARLNLGLSQEEFFLMQPQQLYALTQRWGIAEENREFGSAQITAAIINFSMNAPKRRVSPSDFMPTHYGKKKQREKTKRMRSRKVIAAELEAVMESAMAYQARQGRGQ